MDDDTRGRLLNKVVNFIPPQLDSFTPPLTETLAIAFNSKIVAIRPFMPVISTRW
jgi:hypothetical protein